MRSTMLLLALAACGGRASPTPATPPEPAPPATPRSCLLSGAAPCVSPHPVSVLDGVVAWSDELGAYAASHGGDHPHGVTECRWVAELDDVLLCASADTTMMNPLLTRAALFIEVDAGVVDRDDPLYLQFVRIIGGFDLLKDHPDPARPDLLRYYSALYEACARDQTMCDAPAERAMRGMLAQAWEGRDQFVVITFAHRGEFPDDVVISHEILHAQFFTVPAYREVVEAYWAGLDEQVRAQLRETLGQLGYNPKDEELIMNELQAYILMNGAELGRLGDQVELHREPLENALRARGVAPLQTELRPRQPGW
jgi:hypothetical protein